MSNADERTSHEHLDSRRTRAPDRGAFQRGNPVRSGGGGNPGRPDRSREQRGPAAAGTAGRGRGGASRGRYSPAGDRTGRQSIHPRLHHRGRARGGRGDPATALRIPVVELAANWPADDLWLAVNPSTEEGLALPPTWCGRCPASAGATARQAGRTRLVRREVAPKSRARPRPVRPAPVRSSAGGSGPVGTCRGRQTVLGSRRADDPRGQTSQRFRRVMTCAARTRSRVRRSRRSWSASPRLELVLPLIRSCPLELMVYP